MQDMAEIHWDAATKRFLAVGSWVDVNRSIAPYVVIPVLLQCLLCCIVISYSCCAKAKAIGGSKRHMRIYV